MKRKDTGILIGLHRIVADFDSKTSQIARSYNLTFSQFMVLEALFSKGDMTIGEVRDSILSSMGTISVIITNLEKLSYIKRIYDENDRRKCILQLTESGRCLIEEVSKKNLDMIYKKMSVLDEKEQENLLGLLKKLGGR